MPPFWPIYKRETRAFFQTPSTYVVLALFFLIAGVIFHDIMVYFSRQSEMATRMRMFAPPSDAPNVTETLRGMFQLLSSLVLFTIPILSMRLIAEEKSRGTFELLVTCPVGDWAILLGKYLALLTVGLVLVAISAVYPLIAWWAGRANASYPEWPIVLSCWLGLFLIFATYSAFGLMASSFTENHMAAAIVTLIGLILWMVIGAIQVDHPLLQNILRELSAQQHTANFINGVLMLKDVAFYVLASFSFLFIASKTLDARRWRI